VVSSSANHAKLRWNACWTLGKIFQVRTTEGRKERRKEGRKEGRTGQEGQDGRNEGRKDRKGGMM
jgi:hypothetical protein